MILHSYIHLNHYHRDIDDNHNHSHHAHHQYHHYH